MDFALIYVPLPVTLPPNPPPVTPPPKAQSAIYHYFPMRYTKEPIDKNTERGSPDSTDLPIHSIPVILVEGQGMLHLISLHK